MRGGSRPGHLKGVPKSAEHRAKISAATRSYWARVASGEEYRTSSQLRGGLLAALKEELLERDGGLCQLCLAPIDFSLPRLDTGAATVDHIRPKRRGGTDDVKNLWLAHRRCNSEKRADFIGRRDGTTDSRRGEGLNIFALLEKPESISSADAKRISDRAFRTSTSGVKGVTYIPANGARKWRAQYQRNGVRTVRHFQTLEEATEAVLVMRHSI